MTRLELAELVREILEKPAGERPRLLNAIIRERENAQGAGHLSPVPDALSEWLRQCLVPETHGIADEEMLVEWLAELIEREKRSVPPDAGIPRAGTAFMPMPQNALPDEATVRAHVRAILDRVDRESSSRNC